MRAIGNMLHLSSGQSVRFDADILTAIEVQGVTIVVLAQPEGRDVSENVYGVDAHGRLLWRIGHRDFPDGPDYYVGASVSGGYARLIHFSGFVIEVDPRTGRAVTQRFVK